MILIRYEIRRLFKYNFGYYLFLLIIFEPIQMKYLLSYLFLENEFWILYIELKIIIKYY